LSAALRWISPLDLAAAQAGLDLLQLLAPCDQFAIDAQLFLQPVPEFILHLHDHRFGPGSQPVQFGSPFVQLAPLCLDAGQGCGNRVARNTTALQFDRPPGHLCARPVSGIATAGVTCEQRLLLALQLRPPLTEVLEIGQGLLSARARLGKQDIEAANLHLDMGNLGAQGLAPLPGPADVLANILENGQCLGMHTVRSVEVLRQRQPIARVRAQPGPGRVPAAFQIPDAGLARLHRTGEVPDPGLAGQHACFAALAAIHPYPAMTQPDTITRDDRLVWRGPAKHVHRLRQSIRGQDIGQERGRMARLPDPGQQRTPGAPARARCAPDQHQLGLGKPAEVGGEVIDAHCLEEIAQHRFHGLQPLPLDLQLLGQPRLATEVLPGKP